MFQNFRKYFPGGFLLFMTPLLLRCAPIPAPVSKYYPVRFEDAKVSPRARTIVLVNMLRNDIQHCLPVKSKGAVPYKLSVHYEKGIPSRLFSIRRIREKVCRVTLPENFDDLLALPDALPTLTAWFLAASAGYDPVKADAITNSWYVTGIARKLLRNIAPVKSPFLQYFPAAYVLTSHGIYPSLDSVLSQELTREDSCARLLYEEYSELLVLICSRQGLFRKGLLCALLERSLKDPGNKDMIGVFQDFMYSNQGKKEQALFKTSAGSQKHSGKVLDHWFRQETEKILNWVFLPASGTKMEQLYLQACRFEAPARKSSSQVTVGAGKGPGTEKETAESDDPAPVKMIRGTLSELPELSKSLANPADPALKMALAIGRAMRFASPDLLPALLEVRSALLAFASSQNTGTGKRVLEADQKVYQALERNALLERFLEQTERKALMPGTRYHMTLAVLNRDQKPELPTIRNLEEFLRKTAEKGQKP